MLHKDESNVKVTVLLGAGTSKRLTQIERWLGGARVVLYQASSAFELLYRMSRIAPQLVVISNDLPGQSVDQLVAAIVELQPATQIALIVPAQRLHSYHYLAESREQTHVLVEDSQGQFVGRLLGLINRQLKWSLDVGLLKNRELAATLSALPEAVLVLDEALKVRFANTGAEGLLERSAADLHGKRFDRLLSEDGRESFRGLMAASFCQQRPLEQKNVQHLSISMPGNAVLPCTFSCGIQRLDSGTSAVIVLKPSRAAASVSEYEVMVSDFEALVAQFATDILGAELREFPQRVRLAISRLASLLKLDRVEVLPITVQLAGFQPFLSWPPRRHAVTPPSLNWLKRLISHEELVKIRSTQHLPLDAVAEFDWMRMLQMESMLAIPVQHDGRPVAILAALRRSPQGWSERDVQCVGQISQLVASLLKRLGEVRDFKRTEKELLNVNRRLSDMARTDALTGLANRRLFDKTLLREIRRAARQGVPLSLLIADIDLFKRYNDKLGHVAGDKCLRGMAATIDAVFQRAGDLVARYGGEEFAVVLPGVSASSALHEAMRLRQATEELQISHPDSSVAKYITLSIGIATVQRVLMDPVELVEQADRALYTAKMRGRDHFVHFSEIERKLDGISNIR